MASLRIINFLKKKHKVDIVTLGEGKLNSKNVIIFNQPNFFLKILNILISFLTINPLQFGLFFSERMKKYIKENAKNYDLLFFYHIRSSQYLPKNYKGETIMEMGDLYSKNYFQTFNNLKIFNPLKYIYLLESFLIKKIEKKIFNKFGKILMFSKSEIKMVPKVFRKKICNMKISIKPMENKFLFSKKNNNILFIGNLGYLPNLLAVKDLIKNILPLIKNKIPNVKYYIVGDVSKINKFLLSFQKDVNFLGRKKDIKKYLKNSFCGLANLKIATGIQGKVLTYMSYGLPTICSNEVSSNFKNSVIKYENNNQLLKSIIELKNSKKISTELSKKSLKFIKNFSDKKVCSEYLKEVSFSKKLF